MTARDRLRLLFVGAFNGGAAENARAAYTVDEFRAYRDRIVDECLAAAPAAPEWFTNRELIATEVFGAIVAKNNPTTPEHFAAIAAAAVLGADALLKALKQPVVNSDEACRRPCGDGYVCVMFKGHEGPCLGVGAPR